MKICAKVQRRWAAAEEEEEDTLEEEGRADEGESSLIRVLVQLGALVSFLLRSSLY